MVIKKKSGLSKAVLLFSALGLFFSSLAFPQQEFVNAKVLYKVDGMDKVGVISDIIYKKAGDEEMKMDIYLPPDAKIGQRFPAVIYIHGGYLSRQFPSKPKDWEVFKTHGRIIAASGMVGVTFNHRYYGWDKQNLDDSFSDVRDAIAFVRNNAEKYNVDPDRICLWSVSGGGPHLSIPLKDKMGYVRCIVSYYGVLDLKSVVSIYGLSKDTDWMTGYSPIDYLTLDNCDIPPFFIARAGLDDPTLNATIDSFVGKAIEMNADISVMNHPGGIHGFEIANDDFRTRGIIEDTISFIKRNITAQKTGEDYLTILKGKILGMLKNGDIQKVKDLINGKTGGYSEDQRNTLKTVLTESVLSGIGYSLIGSSNAGKAVDLFEWMTQLYPESANAYDSLADGYEAAGNIEMAIKSVEKVWQLIEKRTGLDEARKETYRKYIEDKLKRLKK